MSFYRQLSSYLQDNPKGYWFKRKLYGWGWVPAKWQGWLATILYVIAILAISFSLRSEPTFLEIFVMTTLIIFATYIFISIAYKKGEKPKWQWGLDKKAKN